MIFLAARAAASNRRQQNQRAANQRPVRNQNARGVSTDARRSAHRHSAAARYIRDMNAAAAASANSEDAVASRRAPRLMFQVNQNGVDLQPLSTEQLLQRDAIDPRTKRGGKLFKDKNAVKAQAKIWLICYCLAVIFFISLRVSDREASPSCEARNSCNCLELFDAFYTIYLIIIFTYTALKVRLSCHASRVVTTRRELKVRGRRLDLIYACLFFVILALLLYAFISDNQRDECLEDSRYQKMA